MFHLSDISHYVQPQKQNYVSFMIDNNITTLFLWKHITKHVVYCTQNINY